MVGSETSFQNPKNRPPKSGVTLEEREGAVMTNVVKSTLGGGAPAAAALRSHHRAEDLVRGKKSMG